MGKKTQEATKERLEAIKQHVKWATQQVPLVAALSKFAEDCAVYAPAPAEKSTGTFDHSWQVQRVVLVPEAHCESVVTIPANYSRLALFNDRGKIVILGADPLSGVPMKRYAELSADVEVVLPGGGIARIAGTEEGYVVKEEEGVDV